MPSRNRVKEYASESYYHIYNRGVNKQQIFEDKEDYTMFLALLKRYLSPTIERDKKKREYPSYANEIDLLAFCLMNNHYHLLVYQKDVTNSIEKLMRSINTAYTIYFNRKYGRVGHLFQDAYKASRITNQAYLEHISRYIHLNPYNWETYEWSSLPYYVGNKKADWVKTTEIIELFGDSTLYYKFVQDYEDYKKDLDLLKLYLAD